MLLNDFYYCHDLQVQGNSITCTISFNAVHDIFNGHFPGQPVVPGVCMVAIVKELLEQQTGKKLILHKAGNIKFLQLITPAIQPLVNIIWQIEETGYNVNAYFKIDDKTLFKMDGKYSLDLS